MLPALDRSKRSAGRDGRNSDPRSPRTPAAGDQVGGAQQSRRIGSRMARGKFVALLDRDDWWGNDKLESQLAIARANERAFARGHGIEGQSVQGRTMASPQDGERVEGFLYVSRGMLQTSTVLAEREIMVSLLEQSAAYNVHNDTMLFLEAQKRGLDIIQMRESSAFFGDNPRTDLISYDVGRVTASLNWFNAVSSGWSVEARKGFILTDMVARYVNVGQRGKAIRRLLGAFHPKLSLKMYVRQCAYVIFNGSPTRFFLRKP